jgi:hypothetical protein
MCFVFGVNHFHCKTFCNEIRLMNTTRGCVQHVRNQKSIWHSTFDLFNKKANLYPVSKHLLCLFLMNEPSPPHYHPKPSINTLPLCFTVNVWRRKDMNSSTPPFTSFTVKVKTPGPPDTHSHSLGVWTTLCSLVTLRAFLKEFQSSEKSSSRLTSVVSMSSSRSNMSRSSRPCRNKSCIWVRSQRKTVGEGELLIWFDDLIWTTLLVLCCP